MAILQILSLFECHLYFTAVLVTFSPGRVSVLRFPFAKSHSQDRRDCFSTRSLLAGKEAEKISSVETLEQENIIVPELRWNVTLESELLKMKGNCFHSNNSNVIPEECFQLSQGCWQGRHILQHRMLCTSIQKYRLDFIYKNI